MWTEAQKTTEAKRTYRSTELSDVVNDKKQGFTQMHALKYLGMSNIRQD